MGNCKDCKYYELQGDGKPAICTKLTIADIWQGFDRLKSDGIGYSDERWESESSVIWVGENFGCKYFEDDNTNKPNG